MQLSPEEVFTPNSFPSYSYVQRQFWDKHAEAYYNPDEKLREALKTQGFFVNIVGPSKSGKTISVKNVVGNALIEITGSELADQGDFWILALKKLGIATEHTRSDYQSDRKGHETEHGLEAGIPKVLSNNLKDKDLHQSETGTEVVGTYVFAPLETLVKIDQIMSSY